MEQGIIDFCPSAVQGSAASIFLTLINALITSKSGFSPDGKYPPDYGPQLKDGDSFDFIVIGAGSAGSVVASRLSENPNWRVLLIEAGSYPSMDSEVPQLTMTLQNTAEDWQYDYEASKHLRFKHKIGCPRGKGLGGSSLLNYMIYFRGHRSDYDSWAEAGNEGWEYDSITKHFKRFENYQDEHDNGFGRKGELIITRAKSDDPVIPSFIEAYRKLGYDNDYSAENPLGTLFSYSTIHNGRRFSTAKAFLGDKIKNSKNLFIALNSQVSKLITDSDLTVKGVEMRLNNKLLKIYANNEVILSAGSVNSPQILMNSGIGPKAHLESHGIKVIKDLSVGENLQDHIYFNGLSYKFHKPAVTPISITQNVDSLYSYFMHGKGSLGEALIKLFGFINPKNDSKIPSLQIYQVLQPKGFFSLPFGNIEMELTKFPECLKKMVVDQNEIYDTVQLLIGLAYPKSRGRVQLRSNDPFDKPLINTNYLSHNEDLTNIIDGIRFLQNLMKTEPLNTFNPEISQYMLPDCQNYNFDSDEYWECMVRNLVRTIYHLVGTCKMGPETDPDAVVDSRLRVHGMKGIRVIDGSVMPTLVGVNTNGPIIMIGEKGSEMIKEDWKMKKDEL